MCSFLVTNKEIDNIERVNSILKRRGPDKTKIIELDGVTYLHNLLHITGEKTEQPLSEKNNIFLFNGEIYNYKGNSDTRYAFSSLLKEGIPALKNMDGEYAMIYRTDKDLFIISDTFGTKPIFYAKMHDKYAISSYFTVLKELGFNNIKKLPPNTIFNFFKETSSNITNFNLDQHIDNFDEWESLFLKSVEKRITDNSFMCISSGYDSGAIALAIKILGKKIPLFCIPRKESSSIIKERESILGPITFIEPDINEYNRHFNIITNFCDNYKFNDYDFLQDKASVGLSIIFERARKRGLNVNISGSGADEIFSDYGIAGRSVFFMDRDSTLKGIYPEDLSSVFPWKNFYNGKQERYIYKEEAVAGNYGIETRYPFLDVMAVQGFLNTTFTLKNKDYKAPLINFFNKHNFPFEQNIKRGFNL